MDFNFESNDFWNDCRIEEKQEKAGELGGAQRNVIKSKTKQHGRVTECLELSCKYEYRRAFSEVQLLNSIKEGLKDGYSYHFITAGDVDALSYLKLVLNNQNLEHCIFSTWCMAGEDILQLDRWLEEGKIKKLDAYLGEIFPNSYKVEYDMIKKLFDKYKCGTYKVLRTHSKIFAGYGDKFYFGIETSANINTNPRIENGVITICKEIYDFYVNIYKDIIDEHKQ